MDMSLGLTCGHEPGADIWICGASMQTGELLCFRFFLIVYTMYGVLCSTFDKAKCFNFIVYTVCESQLAYTSTSKHLSLVIVSPYGKCFVWDLPMLCL